ncbi:bifunctional diguanylate cyclase/phosphodiesterase [Cohaesibacter sp. ES.047]|uniref:putative bifunctional diguanylate cyclase/phosphodiesterase n=1 Tax=Cohaesibacter sp. ES.047 TaxID=1798205 RepID=UPI001561A754|nr:EAL domain-containing protein [Cohaesibacter sp. ES.047]
MYEWFHQWSRPYDAYEIDEAILLLFLLGTAGHAYALRSEMRKKQEIKRRISAEEELNWLSKHDSLTGLPNRRYLQEVIQGYTDEAGGHVGVLSIDLDGFKKANDLLGHAGGDIVLIEVAKRLSSFAPLKHVFRLGGDEFVGLVDLSGGYDLMEVAETLRDTLSQPVKCEGVVHAIGASMGVACYPDDSKTFDDVIHFADLAMYAIKRMGDETVMRFNAGMLAANDERAKIEKDLQKALDDGEIRPHYQPLIDLTSNEVYGFEALARWERPGHGNVSPEHFIRVAEDMGIITRLSEELLRLACIDAMEWPNDIILSFNLSPVQLKDPLLGLRIVKIINQVGFPSHRLELEITESALVQDVEHASEIVSQLRSIGVKLSLDDFGTGYSSLSQLSQLDFDRLKVDQSFISNFKDNEKQMAIVKTILLLSESLGLSTTAEGIENREQLAILKELGCGCGQGYLLGRPVDSASALDLVAQHRKRSDLRQSLDQAG